LRPINLLENEVMKTNQTTPTATPQRGGMLLGVILGLLVGLGIALGVALYIMKVPTTFNNKGVSRSPAQDAQEAKKNKDWDPNAPLSGKPDTKPEAPEASSAASAAASSAIPSETPSSKAVISPSSAPSVAPSAPPSVAPSAPPSAPPSAATATVPKSGGAANTDTAYFVQVAAYSTEAEAHTMRGKLALAGFDGRIVEREQSGRTVYRVRTGPFTQAVGEKTKANLEAAGFETVLIRSQK
jgi:cell division protein FtsN